MMALDVASDSFKPYYKWITFNIMAKSVHILEAKARVLNLIINGLPSIW